MMDSFIKELGVLGSGLLLGFAFTALFAKADDYFSADLKQALATWLQSASPEMSTRRWGDYFIALFDRVFGKRSVSWKCFFRSAIASFVMVGLMVLITPAGRVYWIRGFADFRLLIVLVLVINIFPDYISLIQTRCLLGVVRKLQWHKHLVSILVLDFLLTFIIFSLAWWVVTDIWGNSVSSNVLGGMGEASTAFGDTWGALIDPITPAVDITMGSDTIITQILRTQAGLVPFVYSTFLTSIWIWLYFLSESFFRLCSRNKRAIEFLKWALPIQKKPFRSIGVMAGVIACLSYWIVALLANIAQS